MEKSIMEETTILLWPELGLAGERFQLYRRTGDWLMTGTVVEASDGEGYLATPSGKSIAGLGKTKAEAAYRAWRYLQYGEIGPTPPAVPKHPPAVHLDLLRNMAARIETADRDVYLMIERNAPDLTSRQFDAAVTYRDTLKECGQRLRKYIEHLSEGEQ